MSDPTKGRATCEDLCNLPEDKIGEILEGELILTLEPSWKHHLAAILLDDILAPYRLEEELGPGGWIILLRPKIKFGDNILVPDLAGWKKERFPSEVVSEGIFVVPDWACEILSDDTVVLDKTKKMPIYAKHGLAHLWLVDPQRKTLGLVSIFKLDPESGNWIWLGGHFDKVTAVPFHEMELDFGALSRKIAVIATKRQDIPKSEILSRLRALLEAGISETDPDEPASPK